MQYAYCAVPVAPVRKSAAQEAEQVNQWLFGESGLVLEQLDGWCRIAGRVDGYSGWIRRSQLTLAEEPECRQLPERVVLCPGPALACTVNEQPMHLPWGASLPSYQQGRGQFGSIHYQIEDSFAHQRTVPGSLPEFIQLAESWWNVPYQWGGRNQLGVDCSGLVQVLFKAIGIDLLRDAAQQAVQGRLVDFLQEARPGDLAFFDNEAGEIFHVGVLLSSSKIMHASGQVRIDGIDNAGIIQQENGQRTHRLRIIKRHF